MSLVSTRPACATKRSFSVAGLTFARRCASGLRRPPEATTWGFARGPGHGARISRIAWHYRQRRRAEPEPRTRAPATGGNAAPPRTAKARSTRPRRPSESSCRRPAQAAGQLLNARPSLCNVEVSVPVEELQEDGQLELALGLGAGLEDGGLLRAARALPCRKAVELPASSASRKLRPAFRQACRNSYLRIAPMSAPPPSDYRS